MVDGESREKKLFSRISPSKQGSGYRRKKKVETRTEKAKYKSLILTLLGIQVVNLMSIEPLYCLRYMVHLLNFYFLTSVKRK